MKSIVYILIFLSVSVVEGIARPAEHDMYWIRETGSERNEYVFFRKELQVNDAQVQGNINIYVDSWYALYVNGTYLGYGPSRSYHAHPYYDTYDLAPYLKTGKNVIAIKALSNGMLTFRLRDYHGGIAAWGAIKDGGETIDLSIKNWMSRKAEGYDQTAPRFNFATGAVEIQDFRKDMNWNQAEQTLQNWVKPVRLKNQQLWGDFAKRTIPPLTNHDITAKAVMGAYKLSGKEDIYSFRISTPDPTMTEYQQQKHDILVYTYVYSPEDCEVEGAMWWGSHYLNGESFTRKEKQPNPTYREDRVFKFKKGWNLLTGKCQTIWANLDFYLALPRGKGLEVSATQQAGSEELFYSIGPFFDKKAELLKNIPDFPAGFPDKKLTGYQVIQKRSEQMGSPARDLVWREPDTSAPLPYASTFSEAIQIPVTKDGVTFFIDMGESQLGRIYLDGDFPDGTIIDIGYAEALDESGKPWVYRDYHLAPGMRFITSKDVKRYESFHPYGARYLRVNVRGNSSQAALSKVGMKRQVYPFETIGSFKCSDEIFNILWGAGWRTLQLCAEDSYTDTPYRERTLYSGDMLPETGITLAVSGDMRLVANSLAIFQDIYKKTMYEGERAGEFVLLTLASLDWYTTYTGDWSLAEKYYENYKSLLKLRLDKRDNLGLIPEGGYYFEMTDIRKPKISTPYQALAVKALRILSSFAQKFQKADDAAYFTEQADLLTEAIRKNCWDDSKKAFSDGYDSDGKLVDSYYLTSGIWPALFGVATDEQKKHIIEKAKSELRDMNIEKPTRKVSAYSSFYLLNMLYQNGEAEFAEWYMKKYWTPMALYSDNPTTWEFFALNTGTANHAWTGHPTYFMATKALGVKLGFEQPFDRNKILIEPESGLQWAEGTVTHPAGEVFVRWEIVGDNLYLTYKGPQGVPYEINPKGRLAKYQLWVNNKKQ